MKNFDGIILNKNNEFHNNIIEYLDIDFNIISKNIILNYINGNMSFENNFLGCFNQLKKLSGYLSFNQFEINIDIALSIINDSVFLQSNIKNIIESKKIKNYDEINDDIISLLFQAYSVIYNTALNDDNDYFDDLFDDTDVDIVKIYFHEIGEIPLLSKDEEKNLIIKAQSGDEVARERFTECNLKLVVSAAKRYVSKYSELMDLIQEGNIGFMRAIDKFDVSKGYKFSTYALWWIKQAISRSIAERSRVIKVPVHIFEEINKYKRDKSKLTYELNREPSMDEISRFTGFDISKIRELEQYIFDRDLVSLQTPIGDEYDSYLGDFIVGDDNTEEEVFDILKREEILEIINGLPGKQSNIIKWRYGFGNTKSKTLEEIGQMLGLTRERIRQIESKALKNIRKQINLKEKYGLSRR